MKAGTEEDPAWGAPARIESQNVSKISVKEHKVQNACG